MTDRSRMLLMAVIVLAVALGTGTYLTSASVIAPQAETAATCSHADASGCATSAAQATLTSTASCPVTGATAKTASSGLSCCTGDTVQKTSIVKTAATN